VKAVTSPANQASTASCAPTDRSAIAVGHRRRVRRRNRRPRTSPPAPANGSISTSSSTCTGKTVGHTVEATDCADHTTALVKRTALAEGVHSCQVKPVLHGDNGSTLKATTVQAMLHWLGIAPSYSRPRVSNDNAYAEAWFRTAKYSPGYPARGFASLDEARGWADRFIRWYNTEYRHSGIKHVTPVQRHAGEDKDILAARHALYRQARETNPVRWTGNTRNWNPIDCVTLNPERDSVVAGVTDRKSDQSMHNEISSSKTSFPHR